MNKEQMGLWTMRNRETIYVWDMTDSHLVNVAKMLINIAKSMADELNEDMQMAAWHYSEQLPQIEIYPFIDFELRVRDITVDEWVEQHE